MILALWPGRKFVNDPTRTMRVLGTVTDLRALRDPQGNAVPAMVVWEHGIAAPGLLAAYRATGDTRFRDLARHVCETIVRHACWLEQGQWRIANYLRYRTGADEGLPPEESDYGTWATPTGGGFEQWILPAVYTLRAILDETEPHVITELSGRVDSILTAFPPTKQSDAEWWAIGGAWSRN